MAKRVNATRMELLRLRRRTLLAKKGHKLLKDKLDGLVQQILSIANSYQKLSAELEEELTLVFQKLLLASSQISKEDLYYLSVVPAIKASLEITFKNIMGLKAPKYHLKTEGVFKSLGVANITAELDQALLEFSQLLEKLVLLSQYHKTITLIASHIIEIKRRVNALEYILIPELEGSVRYIRMRLAELERDSIVSLMKIKDIVRGR